MKKILIIFMLLGAIVSVEAQRVLTLDSCRAMALRNNKQLNISKLNKEVARNTHKALRTKYLPKVDASGAYQFTSREVSILDDDQKTALGNFGSNVGNKINSDMTPIIADLTQKGIISSEQASLFGNILNKAGSSMTNALNEAGQKVRDAFRTDTRNIFVASVIVRQPIYMGGAITAANRIAEISEHLADNNIENKIQSTIYDIDQAYWLVVSLKHKQALADNYLKLVQKLNSDVYKMINEGMATRADGLKTDVKVNEAEMAKTQVDDGLVLSKMYLCQLCGISMNDTITLADEDSQSIEYIITTDKAQPQTAFDNRPELRMLENTVDISKQNTKLIRAAYLPQVAAVGGYFMSNPNVLNGFERKFSGYFHIGIMVRVPVWTWFEGRYKVNATRAATSIAIMELNDARDKVELQVNQSNFKVKEANKNLAMAIKNSERAEENLRCANLGFKEGVMQSTEIIAAQTAWMQAQTQKIDAEIEVKLSQVNLEKALGTLQY